MMTDGVNVEAKIEMCGIEVDDDIVRRLLKRELLPADEILAIVYEGIDGNRMELKIVEAKITTM